MFGVAGTRPPSRVNQLDSWHTWQESNPQSSVLETVTPPLAQAYGVLEHGALSGRGLLLTYKGRLQVSRPPALPRLDSNQCPSRLIVRAALPLS